MLEPFLATASTLTLIILSIYLCLIWNANDSVVKLLHRTFGEPGERSPKHIAFVVFVALGFFLCAREGADAMLFWLPSHDEFFEIESVRSHLKLWLGLGWGGTLLFFTLKACEERAHLDEALVMNAGLREILRSSTPFHLESLKKEFEEKLHDLCQQPGIEARLVPPPDLPAYRTIQIYKELISFAENQKSKLVLG